jgi:putative membrane protein
LNEAGVPGNADICAMFQHCRTSGARSPRMGHSRCTFGSNHCEAEIGSKQSETFKLMERRLLKAIINPAMMVTWIAGLYLAWAGHWFAAAWFHAKLLLVLVLSGAHGFFVRFVKDFAADRNPHSQKFYRIINEVPTVLLIGIVILVVVKPF